MSPSNFFMFTTQMLDFYFHIFYLYVFFSIYYYHYLFHPYFVNIIVVIMIICVISSQLYSTIITYHAHLHWYVACMYIYIHVYYMYVHWYVTYHAHVSTSNKQSESRFIDFLLSLIELTPKYLTQLHDND